MFRSRTRRVWGSCGHFCLERPHLGSQPQARWPAVARCLTSTGDRNRKNLGAGRSVAHFHRVVIGHRGFLSLSRRGTFKLENQAASRLVV